MKAKKVVTGAVAALSFLALAATGGLAATIPPVKCTSGKVVATGAGHAYAGATTIKMNLRSVTLTCADTAGASGGAVNADWNGTARTFVIPSSPDKDGIYAAALTALADDDRSVEFYLSNSKAPSTARGNTGNGLIRILHVK